MSQQTFENNLYSNSLSDRAYRLQEKIERISETIEQSKSNQLYEYENRTLSMENKFDKIIDQTEQRFDVMINQQLNIIDQYLNKDKMTKQEQL